MKHFLLAAAALIAAPALAQTTGGTGSGTPVGPDAKVASQTGQTSTDAAQQSMATDQAAPAQTPQTDPAMTQQAPMGAGAQSTGGAAPTAGGYQPAQPALQGSAQPGAPVVFQQAADPATAFPAPAPLDSYPVCKKGQYDKCRQRGGK